MSEGGTREGGREGGGREKGREGGRNCVSSIINPHWCLINIHCPTSSVSCYEPRDI